jgi:hypothetical protein
MFKNLKNWYDRKIHILNFVYKVYKYRSKTEDNIQSYAKQISRSVAYEKLRYNRVLDYNTRGPIREGALPFEGYAGVLRSDWQSQPAKKDE